jgi:chromosome segregation ATPase
MIYNDDFNSDLQNDFYLQSSQPSQEEYILLNQTDELAQSRFSEDTYERALIPLQDRKVVSIEEFFHYTNSALADACKAMIAFISSLFRQYMGLTSLTNPPTDIQRRQQEIAELQAIKQESQQKDEMIIRLRQEMEQLKAEKANHLTVIDLQQADIELLTTEAQKDEAKFAQAEDSRAAETEFWRPQVEEQKNVISQLKNTNTTLLQKIQEQETALDQAHKEVEQLKTELQDEQDNAQSWNETLTLSTTQLKSWSSKAQQLEKDLQQKEGTITQLRQEIEQLKTELQEEQENAQSWNETLTLSTTQLKSWSSKAQQLETKNAILLEKIQEQAVALAQAHKDNAILQDRITIMQHDWQQQNRLSVDDQISQLRGLARA